MNETEKTSSMESTVISIALLDTFHIVAKNVVFDNNMQKFDNKTSLY